MSHYVSRHTIDLPVAVARDVKDSVLAGTEAAHALVELVDEPWLYRAATDEA